MIVFRETCYTYKEVYEQGGFEVLFDKSKKKVQPQNIVARAV